MNPKFNGLVLLTILLGSAVVVPVFAQTANPQNTNSTTSQTTIPPYQTAYQKLLGTNQSSPAATPSQGLTVTTDKASYNNGDMIAISGTSQTYLADNVVTLEIKNPIGNIVKIDQINMGTDKTFSDNATATGALWQQAGTYTVFVQYGSSLTATTTFQFSGSAPAPSAPSTIPVDGTSYSITYTITNGKVLDIKADTQAKSLIVSIQTTGDGMLTITMPRALIDSKKSDGTDDVFVVLNDGQENTQANETTTTNTERTLAIPFKNGTQQIEIIGTFVIPEFGPIAALVLTIAIVSIIAISSKTGLRLLPRY